ncbi:sensor histidine kinase [Cohnella silvisoli]|uniref:histidine kinase n=1 Tax=Cohnella silvisoli TaxID=2873699 RepID=A0ABV1L2X9_9BACL|nr:histidine kinase [Cohnella silvisoli]MCD9025713.1 sensor histidine kinase [Cohnella silvisoli]
MKRPFIYFRHLRFKYKLVWSYVIVVLIPMLALGTYSFKQTQKYSLEQIRLALSDNARKAAEDINYKFQKYSAIADSISYNKQIADIVNIPYTDVFTLYLQLTGLYDPLVENLLTYNEDINRIILYTDNNLPGRMNSIQSIERLRNALWFEEVIKSNRTHWKYENGKLFGIKRMMIDPGSISVSLLYVELKYESVIGSLDNGQSREYSVLITDGEENVIFPHNEWPGGSDAREEMNASDAHLVLKDGIQKNQYITISNPIPEAGWTITYFYPVKEFMIHAGDFIGTLMIIVCVCLLILMLLIWVFTRTLVRRIEYLNKKIKLIGQGDFQVIIHDPSRDEVGKLAAGISQMLSNINQLITTVRQSHEEQREAEMRALQAQINPHFLYNSLSLINWKAIKMKAMDISLLTTSLSKFYRTTLNRGKGVISIREELENIKAYLDIQLMMHDHSFQFSLSVEEQILDCEMIHLILQPLVENAIEHGIDNRNDNKGLLKIRGYLKGGFVEFSIEDNGPGMRADALSNVHQLVQGGYGLRNIEERLKLCYGTAAVIKITSGSGKGTKVRISFPINIPANRQ